EINIYSTIAFLNSKIGTMLIKMVNPTLNASVGDILTLPYKKEEITANLVDRNISLAKKDWDSYEISRNFKKHPFIGHEEKKNKVSECFSKWESTVTNRRLVFKENQEKINSILIELYGLEN